MITHTLPSFLWDPLGKSSRDINWHLHAGVGLGLGWDRSAGCWKV